MKFFPNLESNSLWEAVRGWFRGGKWRHWGGYGGGPGVVTGIVSVEIWHDISLETSSSHLLSIHSRISARVGILIVVGIIYDSYITIAVSQVIGVIQFRGVAVIVIVISVIVIVIIGRPIVIVAGRLVVIIIVIIVRR